MTYGEVVKGRRLELEMTQRELSEIAGTDQQTLTRIESYGIGGLVEFGRMHSP